MRAFKGLSISPSKAPSHAISTVEDAFSMALTAVNPRSQPNLGGGAAPLQWRRTRSGTKGAPP